MTSPRTRARKIAASSFALVAALGVVVLEFRFGPFSRSDSVVLIPYVAVVLVAGLFGALFSGWYFSKTGVFELVATPTIIMVGATLVAGQIHSFISALSLPYPPDLPGRVAGGFYASLVYLSASWPAIVPLAAIVSYALWKRYRYDA